MPDNKVILEFGPETKALISEFIAAVRGTNAPVTAPQSTQHDPEPAAGENAPTVPETAVPVRVVTNDDVLKRVTELIRDGKKDAARDIVTSYASGVSTIPADKCAEVMDKLNALV
jgi:hypothetical protein